MSAVGPVAPRPWPRRRWWGLVALLFAAQVAFIFGLSDGGPILPRKPAAAPRLRLAGPAAADLLALTDPTLFVLPHSNGVSGPAWLRSPRLEFHPFDWSEPTNWLALPLEQLGAAFDQFIQTNQFSSLQIPLLPQPESRLPEPPPLASSAEPSTVRIESGLAATGSAGTGSASVPAGTNPPARRLLTPLPLRPWPFTDLLTNTVVQILVNAEGQPVSVALLSSCGLKDADQYALAQAKAARFESLSDSGTESLTHPTARLSWVRLIFQWQTLPMPPTNSAAAQAP